MSQNLENLILRAYHLEFDSTWEPREYIINSLKYHFACSGNIYSIICGIRAFNKSNLDGTKRFLKFDFFNKNEKSFPCDAFFYKSFYTCDDALLGTFFKTLDANSFVIITSKHSGFYESLEEKLNGCHVMDMDSVVLYKQKVEKVKQNPDDASEINNYKVFNNFELNYLFGNNEKQQWTALIFPLFFLSDFVGLINVVFSGELDINSIENLVEFMGRAKQIYYREIVDYIVSDWLENNDQKGFPELLQYVLSSIKEIPGDIIKYYDPFIEAEKSKKVEIPIYIPPFNISHKTNMPLLINFNKKKKYYYIDRPIENSAVKMKLSAFDDISHIHWLWQLWRLRIDTNHKNKV